MSAPNRDVLDAWRRLDAAQKASEKACDARGALPLGSSRAKTTSANARWMNAAEDRDRALVAYREALAAECKVFGVKIASSVSLVHMLAPGGRTGCGKLLIVGDTWSTDRPLVTCPDCAASAP